jgi:hypothetical protein
MTTEIETILGYSILTLLGVCGCVICYVCKPLKRVRFQTAVERIEYSPMPSNEQFMEKIDTLDCV